MLLIISVSYIKRFKNYLNIIDNPYSLATRELKAELKKYDGQTVVMGIRPEYVHDDELSLSKANVIFETKVNVYELLGAEVFLYFDIDGNAVTARVEPDTPARVGDTIKVCFDVNKINVFDKESKEAICN